MSMRLRWVPHGSTEYQGMIRLRSRVLREPLGLAFQEAELEAEADQLHLGAWLEEELVGCLVLKVADGIAKMRQVAVSPAWQGHRIGSTLVKEFEAEARRKSLDRIELNARLNVVPFYESLGYSPEGEVFDEVTIPHRKMTKVLINR